MVPRGRRGANCGTEARRARARVSVQLGLGRRDRLGNLFEGRSGSGRGQGPMARTAWHVAAADFQEAFDDAVFQAVEGDHRQAAAGTKRPLGGPESLLQLVKLSVQMDSDRLKSAGRRIALLARAIA